MVYRRQVQRMDLYPNLQCKWILLKCTITLKVIIFLLAIPLIKENETSIDAGNCSHDHKCSAVTDRAFFKPATVFSASWAETIWKIASPSLDIWACRALANKVGVAVVGLAVGAADGVAVGLRDGLLVGVKDGSLVGASKSSSIDSYKALKDSVAADPGSI